MDKDIGNFNIEEIKNNVIINYSIGLLRKTSHYSLGEIRTEIIDCLGSLSFTIIHDALEGLLYWATYTDMIVEFDYYVRRFLENQGYPDEEIYIAVNNIIRYQLDKRITRLLEAISKSNIRSAISKQYFAGWILSKDNMDFFTRFDFLLASESSFKLLGKG